MPAIYGLPAKAVSRFDYGSAIMRTRGAEAYWPLQKESGLAVPDLYSGLYDAVANGTVTAGQDGPVPSLPKSMNFNGGAIHTGFQLRNIASASFACWFKTSSTNTNMYLWDARGNNSATCLMGIDGLGHGAAGKIHYYADASGIANGTYTNATFNDGKWHFLVVTVRGDMGSSTDVSRYLIYVDGAKQATSNSSNSSAFTAPWSTVVPYTLGNLPAENGPFIGNLAGVAAFTTALTPDDVSRLYHAAIG